MPNTVRLHRVLRVPPERGCRAFLDVDTMDKQKELPDVIPAEACCFGWQESLTLLAKLVEAEIPD